MKSVRLRLGYWKPAFSKSDAGAKEAPKNPFGGQTPGASRTVHQMSVRGGRRVEPLHGPGTVRGSVDADETAPLFLSACQHGYFQMGIYLPDYENRQLPEN